MESLLRYPTLTPSGRCLLNTEGKFPFGLVTGLVIFAMALATAGYSLGRIAHEGRGVFSSRFGRTEVVTVPAGAPVNVVVDQSLSTGVNQSGETFEASVASPLIVDGKTVIPKGASVVGRIVDLRRADSPRSAAHLELALESVQVGKKSYGIHTTVNDRRGGKPQLRTASAPNGRAVAALLLRKDIRLRPETPLTFKLEQPVTIEVKG